MNSYPLVLHLPDSTSITRLTRNSHIEKGGGEEGRKEGKDGIRAAAGVNAWVKRSLGQGWSFGVNVQAAPIRSSGGRARLAPHSGAGHANLKKKMLNLMVRIPLLLFLISSLLLLSSFSLFYRFSLVRPAVFYFTFERTEENSTSSCFVSLFRFF